MTQKATQKPEQTAATDDWSIGVRVSVDRHGQTILDQPVADLLTTLDRTGSINAAAKLAKVSYRHAWLTLNAANVHAGTPLFEATVGGMRGGGTRLTDHGRNALRIFREVQRQVGTAAAQSLRSIVQSHGQRATVVHLAAAISLQEALAQAITEYTLARPTMDVRTMFGASDELADQILAGAAVDVFVSANERHVDRLDQAGLIAPDSRCRLASNTLVVVGPEGLVESVSKPTDLRATGKATVVVAQPSCPLGECTATFLRLAGLAEPLQSRLQYAENSRAVVAALRASDARLGIVFESDVQNLLAGLRTLFRIPSSKAKAIYEGAALSRTTAAAEAQAVLAFLRSHAAQACFRRCGFLA